MKRFLLTPLLFAALLAVPVTASAHGHATRGMLITRPQTVGGQTGPCSCEREWYTLGLRPGRLNLTVAFTPNGMAFGHDQHPYGIDLFLVAGVHTLAYHQVSCTTAARHCQGSARLSYQIKHKGVYYVLVHGTNAEVRYSLRVQGRLYTLH